MTKLKYRVFWIYEFKRAGMRFTYDKQNDLKKSAPENFDEIHVVEKRALTDLQEQCDRLETALEVYAMVNETFPEYGEAAIKTLAEYRKWKNQE